MDFFTQNENLLAFTSSKHANKGEGVGSSP